MCVRGYQKKVIFIKNAGSNFFEEAYFVLKDDEKNRIFSHATMVSEANKIIEENFENYLYCSRFYWGARCLYFCRLSFFKKT